MLGRCEDASAYGDGVIPQNCLAGRCEIDAERM